MRKGHREEPVWMHLGEHCETLGIFFNLHVVHCFHV